MSQYKLAERAVLMRFSAGLPGKSRKDPRTTQEVKSDKGLGENAGRWIADLYPDDALDAIKSKQGEARAYHNRVTFPFGSSGEDESEGPPAIKGIGILPAVLIKEYADTMRQFNGEQEKLIEDTFLADPQRWINWARSQHNGTFNPKNYPGCTESGFDADEFRKVMRKKFYLRSEPLPVPDAEQFTASVSALLGSDLESVNLRVADATREAQRELMRRLIAPVKHMADTLAKESVNGKKPRFNETLIGNISEIVSLGPKLNMSGDPQIDGFIKDMEKLTRYSPVVLRQDEMTRADAANSAAEMFQRLSGYKL